MSAIDRQNAQVKVMNLMLYIYDYIQKIEKDNHNKILVMENDFNFYVTNPISNGFGMKTEPFFRRSILFYNLS